MTELTIPEYAALTLQPHKGGYHFTEAGIQKIENEYNAKYMGHWTIKRITGWSEIPVDVFYVENPDRSKGHTNYFGMFRQEGNVYITEASSAFSEPIRGIVVGKHVIVSRYRHDYVVSGDAMVDGGRDYFKHSPVSQDRYVFVTVKGGEFVISPNLPGDNEHDPDLREWAYDGNGKKVYKGTMKAYP